MKKYSLIDNIPLYTKKKGKWNFFQMKLKNQYFFDNIFRFSRVDMRLFLVTVVEFAPVLSFTIKLCSTQFHLMPGSFFTLAKLSFIPKLASSKMRDLI